MSQRFLFKFSVIVVTTLLLTALFIPLVGAAFALKEGSWRYGYAFIDISWKSNLIVSLGIGMSLAVWNAFEFERYPNLEISQYFKPYQRYHFITQNPVSLEMLKTAVDEHIIRKGWKVREWMHDGVVILRRNYIMKDVVKIRLIPNGLEISSRPRWRILLIDMARNYRNIENVSRRLKHLK